HRCATSTAACVGTGDIISVHPRRNVTHHRIDQRDAERRRGGAGSDANIHPELVHVHDGRIAPVLRSEVKVVDRDNARNGALRRQHFYLLRLMELIPERMGGDISHATQSQIALIRYLAHNEPDMIEPARNQPARVTAAHGQQEIAQLVAMPETVRGHHGIGSVEFLARRRVVGEPRPDRGNGCEVARRRGNILGGGAGREREHTGEGSNDERTTHEGSLHEMPKTYDVSRSSASCAVEWSRRARLNRHSSHAHDTREYGDLPDVVTCSMFPYHLPQETTKVPINRLCHIFMFMLGSVALLALGGTAIQAQAPSRASASATAALNIPVEFYKLDNGLRVVLSPDSTTPTAVVAVYYNIGFRNEPRDRTGFAHLFEHLMFQGSKNLGKLQFVRLVEENGGILNGSTRFDFTNYFQVVPSNAVRRILWAEADRMKGLAIDTSNVNNQRDVVKNEVRVNVINQPYGGFPWIDLPIHANTNWYNAHNFYGDMGDLDKANLADATSFFHTYYAPN